MMNKRIYLDNAATTCIDDGVIKEMMPYLSGNYGNASSLHYYGTVVKEIIQSSRKKIANYVNAKPEELIFTGSGTEANNFALKGIAFANREKGNHIIVSLIEHDCVLNACYWLEKQGFYITFLPVDKFGVIDLDLLQRCINKKTILVSVMHANNEIGTIQPIKEIGKICKNKNVYFHTDACQSFGKIPIDVEMQNIDLLTINSHKIYGPKGIGALYIRKGVKIDSLLHGGGQELGLRSSTENTPAIVGFAKAAELCFDNLDNETIRLEYLRKKIVNYLSDNVEGIYFNGHPSQRLSNIINFCISGMEGEGIKILLLLDEKGIAVSAGSACSSNDKSSASHVLQAIGLNQFEARGSIRISLGRFNNDDDIQNLVAMLSQTIHQLNPIFSC